MDGGAEVPTKAVKLSDVYTSSLSEAGTRELLSSSAAIYPSNTTGLFLTFAKHDKQTNYVTFADHL